MKRILTIFGILILTALSSNANGFNNDRRFDNPPPPPPHKMQFEKPNATKNDTAFEQRLGLTESQKTQAKAIREQGFERIKPVIDTLKAREQEAITVKNSNSDSKVKEEKLNSINSDIANLRKKAHDIKHENMKEFEAILTQEQKKILKEMKQEGRKKYQENRSCTEKRPDKKY